VKVLAQLKVGIVVCCLLVAAGCAQHNAPSASKGPDIAVSGIAVLPVKPVSDLDESLASADEKFLQNGSLVLDGLMKEMLASKAGIHFISTAQAGKMRGTGYNLATAKSIAAQTGCNVILETTLSRYNERVGGEYGAKQPAAVTFAYKLYEVGEGRVLCHGRFDEQQQSLMENLLDLPKAQSRGLVWLTAEELARDGLKERLAQCPYLEKK
jgi:hypothetical protein